MLILRAYLQFETFQLVDPESILEMERITRPSQPLLASNHYSRILFIAHYSFWVAFIAARPSFKKAIEVIDNDKFHGKMETL